jgi:hypothetical protein
MAVIKQIGALAMHLAQKLFLSPTNPPSIDSILASDHLRLRTRSIAQRVTASCGPHIRVELDDSIKGSGLYTILQDGSNLELSDIDLFLLDILPLNFFAPSARYSYMLDQIASNIHKLAGSRLQPSLRLLLCMRAAKRILRLRTPQDIPQESHKNLATKINMFSSFVKQPGLTKTDFDRVSMILASAFDILSLIKPPILSSWKTWLINCQPLWKNFPPLLKISFVQFLAVHIPLTDKDEISSMQGPLDIFSLFINDLDWRVSAEALIAYHSFRVSRPLDLGLNASTSKIEKEIPHTQLDEDAQSLVAATQPLSTKLILQQISSIKVSLQRHTQDPSTCPPDLAREYAITLAKLSSIEQKLAAEEKSKETALTYL